VEEQDPSRRSWVPAASVRRLIGQKPLVKRRLERAKQVGLLGKKHVTENM